MVSKHILLVQPLLATVGPLPWTLKGLHACPFMLGLCRMLWAPGRDGGALREPGWAGVRAPTGRVSAAQPGRGKRRRPGLEAPSGELLKAGPHLRRYWQSLHGQGGGWALKGRGV